ncbi:uncharacterized protein [Aegilops tauschii subsp. strangulata]|uniref:uncharacterized protein n=1 Tax=Aegilops tauschii subsp. strangulata TaxID=200361 RepID=UPI00098BC732|nr:uncharacterized protein LOC109735829 [Aegilops tauschii subsp. strangulata]
MTRYCNVVRKLEKKFEGLELHHIPRLKNQAADDLAKIGSTWKPIPSNVFLEHLQTPSVQEDPFTEEPPQPISSTNPTEVEVPAVVDLIMEVFVIIPDWTVPYIAYLLRQELPEDEDEAHQILYSELRHKYNVRSHSELHHKYNIWVHSEMRHKYDVYSE